MNIKIPLSILATLALFGCQSNEPSDETRLEIYSESAFVHYEGNDLARAESQALKGLAIDSRHVPLNLMMGWILLRQDTRDTLLRAEQVFRRLIDEEDEEDHRVYIGLATSLERLGAFHEEAAIAVAEGTRRTDAADPKARALELHAESLALREESLGLYQTALRSRPKNIKALNGAMRVASILERPDESLAYCDTLIATLASERKFWTGLLQKEDLNAEDESGLRDQVNNARNLMLSACIFAANLEHDLKRNDAALARLNYALELNPDLPECYSMRAQLLAESGQLEDAVADIDRFIARSDKPYEHPDIRRAFELMTTWNRTIETGQKLRDTQ